jgi:hypothetical protein
MDVYFIIIEIVRNKVFDLFYYLMPKINFSQNILNILNTISIFILILPLFINKTSTSNWTLIKTIISIYIPVALIRVITTNLTILPSDIKCNINEFNINELIVGYCYDKLFSGHLAITLVAMYVYYTNNIINKYYAYGNILFIIIYMLLTKGHYTNDLLFSFFVVYFVIKENIII